MDVLLTLLVVVLIFGAIFWLVGYIGLDPKPKQIVQAILAVIGILVLLGVLFGRVPLVPFGW